MINAVDFDKTCKKTDGKKQSTIRGIPKLDDANWAGTSKSDQCSLILTEGDSAKTMAVSGLSIIGRDKFGIFPLKGKLLNCKDTLSTKISNNEEINNLKKIIGLETGKSYDSVHDLRYGKIILMTDSDVDGSHIKGLVFNMFHSLWPSLFKIPSFLSCILTPIVKVSKNKSVIKFYNLTDYENWSQDANIDKVGWNCKYFKGLALIHSLRGSCPSLTHALVYVQPERGTAIGDIPFIPEIYSGGSLRPICLTAGDDSMVTSICEAAGFPDGGFLVENEERMYAVDALPPFPP